MNKFGLAFLCTFTLLSACSKPPAIHSSEAVQQAVDRYVKAIRQGDGQALYALSSSLSQKGMGEEAKLAFPGRKDFGFKLEGVLLRDNSAGVFGRFTTDDHPGEDEEALLFVLENGQWRLDRMFGSNRPIHRPSFAPPETGKFMTAGMPWQNVPVMELPEERPGVFSYQLQVAADEAFLYLKLSFATPLPKLDTPLEEGGPLPEVGPRSLRVNEKGGKDEFSITFDTTMVTHYRNGKNSFALGYTLSLDKRESGNIFTASPGSDAALFRIGEQEILAKIPLESMGVKPGKEMVIHSGSGFESGPGYVPKMFL